MHSTGSIDCTGPAGCVNVGLTWSDTSPVDFLPSNLAGFTVKSSRTHSCFVLTPSTKQIGPKNLDTCGTKEKGYICQFECPGEWVGIW